MLSGWRHGANNVTACSRSNRSSQSEFGIKTGPKIRADSYAKRRTRFIGAGALEYYSWGNLATLPLAPIKLHSGDRTHSKSQFTVHQPFGELNSTHKSCLSTMCFTVNRPLRATAISLPVIFPLFKPLLFS